MVHTISAVLGEMVNFVAFTSDGNWTRVLEIPSHQNYVFPTLVLRLAMATDSVDSSRMTLCINRRLESTRVET